MLLATAAPAQRSKAKSKARSRVAGYASGAENQLAGIKLFDPGSKVVGIYGSPDSIEAVSFGGGSGAGPGGGGGGAGLPGGGRSGGAPPARGPGGAGGAAAPGTINSPVVPSDFDFGNDVLMQQGTPPGTDEDPSGRAGGGSTGSGGGVKGGNTGGGGSFTPLGDQGIVYTRWVYNRNGAKYGFILDKYNRVVQCEAIGITAGRARTKRGVTFGSSFATLIKKYGAPDGYEIAGDNLVVRYLSRAKVAFRMSRLAMDKPQVVTGIVVAAGKR